MVGSNQSTLSPFPIPSKPGFSSSSLRMPPCAQLDTKGMRQHSFPCSHSLPGPIINMHRCTLTLVVFCCRKKKKEEGNNVIILLFTTLQQERKAAKEEK